MENLDYYLSTPDEHFNLSAQYWYFEFKNKKPNTEKPVEVFLEAFHEVYFFIQDNLDKPFGCIEKINNVSEASGFNEAEKLILLDKILGILFHHPEQGKQQKIFIQLVDFRNNLSPWMDDPEIQNPNWHFNFEAIKAEFATIKTSIDKLKFLMNLYFDYLVEAPKMNELERQYYNDIGFFQWMEAELAHYKYENHLETYTPTPETESRLGKYTNSQLVLIFYYFFKGLGIELRRDTDIAPIAKFLHLITGKKLSKIQNSDFYIKLSKAPNFNADKSLFDDLNYIKPSFEAVGLNNVVRLIDNEIDLCRRGE